MATLRDIANTGSVINDKNYDTASFLDEFATSLAKTSKDLYDIYKDPAKHGMKREEVPISKLLTFAFKETFKDAGNKTIRKLNSDIKTIEKQLDVLYKAKQAITKVEIRETKIDFGKHGGIITHKTEFKTTTDPRDALAARVINSRAKVAKANKVLASTINSITSPAFGKILKAGFKKDGAKVLVDAASIVAKAITRDVSKLTSAVSQYAKDVFKLASSKSGESYTEKMHKLSSKKKAKYKYKKMIKGVMRYFYD